MFRLLKFLFTGSWHEHQWKIIKIVKVCDFDASGAEYQMGRKYIQQCEKCGKMKKFQDF